MRKNKLPREHNKTKLKIWNVLFYLVALLGASSFLIFIDGIAGCNQIGNCELADISLFITVVSVLIMVTIIFKEGEWQEKRKR